MTSPTWFFDGVLRRIYEVPPGASFTTDGNGYRIYDGGPGAPALLSVDVQKDLWSRWVDWHALHDWALLAFSKAGGALRPNGQPGPVDFTCRTSVGWRLVLANYPHETQFFGNFFPEGADSIFDYDRITALVPVPRLEGSANLLTYSYATGGADAAAVAEAVWQHATGAALAARLAEVWGRLGLDASKPVTQGNTQISFGAIVLALALDGNGNGTITRQ